MANIQNNNNTKNTSTRILYFFLLILLIILVITKIYKCPLDFVFGIPCPMCGMTRAILCVFQLKFKEAFYFHALWPFVFVFLPIYIYTRLKKIKINKRLLNTLLILFSILL